MKHIVVEDGLRIDRYCSQYISELTSLKRAKKWVKQGNILLEGTQVETSRFVRKGDCLTIIFPTQMAEFWKKEIEVIYEDEFLAVVYKPPGVPVSGNRFKTLRNALPSNVKGSSESDRLSRPEPVHRLDRKTQGLVLVAKTNHSRHLLGQMFQERNIEKEYQCLCLGTMENGESKEMIDGKSAHTIWQVLSVQKSHFTGSISHLKVQIHTGRQHQIRKHLFWKEHPILGDNLYCFDHSLRSKGLYLFATRLRFLHPMTSQVIDIIMDIPDKLQKRILLEQRMVEDSSKNC